MVRHFSFSAFLFSLLFLCHGFSQDLQTAAPDAVGMSSERLEFLDTNLKHYVDDGQLPGVVVLLARNNRIFYHKAFGYRDKESDSKLSKDALFRIASQTKAIISVAAMILQEEGKLNIKHAVSKYIPAFKETTVAVPSEEEGYSIEKAKRQITIRDLLTHTSGIGYGYGVAEDAWKKAEIQGWYFADRDEPILETVKRMAALPMDAHPGEKWVYGYSTDILGAVVELAASQPLNEFLKERIFTPLGMKDTHFYLPEEKKKRLATVYSYKDNRLERAPDPGHMVGQGHYAIGPKKSFSGGAGLLSSAHDYAKFLQMMLNKGTLNGKRILSRKSVELMTVDHLGAIEYPWTNGMGFGLGFSTVENLGTRGSLGSEGEFGWGGAYHSSYWVDPKEELVVVYFTQVIPANGLDDHEKIRNLIYQAIED